MEIEINREKIKTQEIIDFFALELLLKGSEIEASDTREGSNMIEKNIKVRWQRK